MLPLWDYCHAYRQMAERACNARMQLVLIDMHALETEQWTAENRPTRRLMKTFV